MSLHSYLESGSADSLRKVRPQRGSLGKIIISWKPEAPSTNLNSLRSPALPVLVVLQPCNPSSLVACPQVACPHEDFTIELHWMISYYVKIKSEQPEIPCLSQHPKRILGFQLSFFITLCSADFAGWRWTEADSSHCG